MSIYMMSSSTDPLVSTIIDGPSDLSLLLFPQPQPQPQLPGKQWGSFLINIFLFLFLPSEIVSKSVLETHNLQDFTLVFPAWYLEPPTLPLRPQDVLTHVHPIEMMLHLPPGPSDTPLVSRPAPLPPIETRDKATKTTTNTIYMISRTSFPSVSLAMEDPPDLSRHHLHDDREIHDTTFDFTPFHLNHNVELVLPIKD